MGSEWIEYKGKKILLADFKGVKNQDQMIEVLRHAAKLTESETGGILYVMDITDAVLGPDFMRECKTRGAELNKKVKKSAIVGVTGLKKILLKGYTLVASSNIKPMETREEALEYMIS